MSSKLFDWTNDRWIITFSKTKGDLSKKEKESYERVEIIKKIKDTETYKFVLGKFPDAELIDVKNIKIKDKND